MPGLKLNAVLCIVIPALGIRRRKKYSVTSVMQKARPSLLYFLSLLFFQLLNCLIIIRFYTITLPITFGDHSPEIFHRLWKRMTAALSLFYTKNKDYVNDNHSTVRGGPYCPYDSHTPVCAKKRLRT